MADPTPRPNSAPRKRILSPPPAVRLAQLVRTPTIARPPVRDGEVVVEVGGARITVAPNADLTAVVTILALLGGRS